MAIISVKEYQSISISDEINQRSNQQIINWKQAESLEKFEKRFIKKGGHSFLEWKKLEVKFKNYVGVINLGRDTVEIFPKIYGLEDNTGESKKCLIHMLVKTNKLKIIGTGQSDLNVQNISLLDLFINNFCEELFKQVHKGLIRTYLGKENNLSLLKGKIVFNEQLTRNLFHKERLYCRYNELTDDNCFNQVFKYVIKKLKSLAKSNHTKKILYELSLIFDHITDKNITVHDVDQLPINRLVKHYNPVIKMARMFLAGEFLDVYSGKTTGFAVLFKMDELFEEFVAQTLKKIVLRNKLSLKIQGPKQFLMYERGSSKNLFLLKPDLTIIDPISKRPVAVLDTKWKKLEPRINNFGVLQSDVYQMQAYAKHYKCETSVLVYPHYSQLNVAHPTFMFHEGGGEIGIKTLDLGGLTNNNIPSVEHQLSELVHEIKDKYTSLN